MLENEGSYGLSEIEMASLAGELFAAGIDTVEFLCCTRRQKTEIRCQTTVSICTVLMAAARFPEEQAKVQAELDSVIGRQQGSSSLLQSYQFDHLFIH
jgi:hypothetical protein